MRSAVLAAAALILMPEVSPFAQSEAGDWEIGELDLSGLKWGKQTRRIPIRNNTDDYHFLVAHCVTQSARQGYARPRETVSNYVVLPGEQGLVHIVIDVPESFAEVTVTFGIYDVVDTLDDLALGSKLYGREERVKVIFPESLEAIRESNLRAGWILRYNESLSDDLQLALNLMLARGEPISKIAESTGLPTEYVIHLVRLLSENGLARITDTAISSALVAVEDLPFRRIDALISASARDMQAALIQASAIYHSEHKRLILDGKVAAQGHQAVEGTGFLHHLYPVIGGLVIWERVGSEFLGFPDGPAELMSQTSPCDAAALGYGYILADPAALDGKCYFHFDTERQRKVFGIGVAKMLCYKPSAGSRAPNYRIVSGKRPILYLLDVNRAEELLRLLYEPLIPIRDGFESDIKALFKDAETELTKAHRLWLWNRLATEVMDLLIESGVIENQHGLYFTWKADDG